MAVKVQSTMFYTQRCMNSITLHSVTAMKVTFVCSVSASHENKALLSFDRENFTSHLCWTLLYIRGKLNSVLHGVSVPVCTAIFTWFVVFTWRIFITFYAFSGQCA